jgi:hypothetical protein
MLLAGIAAAMSGASVTKRLIGVLVAMIGALLAAAAAGASLSLIVVGAALTLAYSAIGAALLVRLQESYGTVETFEIDAADAESDTAELNA